MKSDIKKKSIDLRQKGYSVKEISDKLSVAKSTVSTWVRNITLTSQQKLLLKNKNHSPEIIERRRQTRLKNELNRRNLLIKESSKDIKKISKDMLKIIGIGIYWGEGAKTMKGMARVSNSDPAIIKMIMRFFREICEVPENRFHAHIHIHSPEAIEDSERYWSDITGIPISQFYKTYAIKSKGSKSLRTTLKYGTIDVGVCDTKLLLRILGWIEGFKQQLT